MGKLVRDNIPEIVKAETGAMPQFAVLREGKDFVRALKAKLVEEALEVQSARSQKSVMTELADVLEVVENLRAALGIPMRDLEGEQRRRRHERGSFEKRMYLEN